MQYNKDIHRRRSIRLKDYDYSQTGAYFVTVCSWNKGCVFGDIVDGALQINECGQIVQDEWMKTADIRTNVELDEFAVMPNHIHGIIVLADNVVLDVGNEFLNGAAHRQCRGEAVPRPGSWPWQAQRKKGDPPGRPYVDFGIGWRNRRTIQIHCYKTYKRNP